MRTASFIRLVFLVGFSLVVSFQTAFLADGGDLPAAGAGKDDASATPTYLCRRITGEIQINGKLDEEDWRGAEEVRLLNNSGDGEFLSPKTTAKMLWDEKYLYVAFVAEDSDIFATMTKRDDHLWTEEVVEVFVGREDIYVEIEVSPLNTLFDATIDLRGQKGRPTFDVDAAAKANFDIRHRVIMRGPPSKRKDKDDSWTVELAIPHTALKGIQRIPPKSGDAWRINLYRIDKSIVDGRDTTAAGAWSPTKGWFHNPPRFGRVVFTTEK